MFGNKKITQEDLDYVEKRLSGNCDEKFNQLRKKIEELERRTRNITASDGLEALIKEISARLDKTQLITAVTEELKETVKVAAQEETRKFLDNYEFYIDDDTVCDAASKILADKITERISLDKVAECVAENLVNDDALDLGEIESMISDEVLGRLVISFNKK